MSDYNRLMPNRSTHWTTTDAEALQKAELLVARYDAPDQPLGEEADEDGVHLVKYHLSPDDQAVFAGLRQRFAAATSPEARLEIAWEIVVWYNDWLMPEGEPDRFIDTRCPGYPDDGENGLCIRSPLDLAIIRRPIRD